MMSQRLTPLYTFDDAAEYHRRHSKGVLKEFENESREVNAFNERQTQFKAWVIANIHRTKDKSYWVFLVRPGDSGGDYLFPKEGDTCEILLWSRSGKVQRSEKYWEAERIENPAASFGIPEGEAHRIPAFKITVPNNVSEDTLHPLEDDPDDVGYNVSSRLTKKFALSDKKAVRVTMKLHISSATKDAELGAINKLFKNPDDSVTPKQEAAFKYLLNFRKVPFTIDLFNHFPHLRDPLNNPGGMPPKVVTMLKGFNAHQQMAYKNILRSLPCGICIIPGGPGAGKTHWNLAVTAAIQSKDIVFHGPDNYSNRSAKILYVLDINKPLDDTCNKIVRLYKSLGLKKYTVRLYGWKHYKSGGKLDFSSKFIFTARMSRYRRQKTNETCLAPTLDELAWDIYQENKNSRYRVLHDELTKALTSSKKANPAALKDHVNQLYHDVLDRVDFIATTPVPAATGFGGLFKPDIVIFDESPHAREASTMVVIAHYEPIAWVFSGDHRQTRPFIASDDVRDNPWAPQMLISMMERAEHEGAVRHSLLINHRAYGGLQQLASDIFYKKKMITGHKEQESFPPSVFHIQRYLERFLQSGQKCREPRIIAFDSNRSEARVGTSWFNQKHIDWVMERVMELLPDPMFRQVGKNERGTILIVSPYKESYMKYKKAIKGLPASWKTRLNVEGRVEARTIDTVQGGEADFVFLDLVRSEATQFTDDPNRLNVALTRARQGEVIMMHPGMRQRTQYLSRVFNHCEDMGHVVDITKRGPQPMAQVPNEEREHEQYLSYQQQLNQGRATYGIDHSVSDTRHEAQQDSDICGLQLVGKSEPESIFASQFAKLAVTMERILEERRASEPSNRIKYQGKNQAQSFIAAESQSAIDKVCTGSSNATNIKLVRSNQESSAIWQATMSEEASFSVGSHGSTPPASFTYQRVAALRPNTIAQLQLPTGNNIAPLHQGTLPPQAPSTTPGSQCSVSASGGAQGSGMETSNTQFTSSLVSGSDWW